MIDYNHPALNEQIITYLGNKRKLVPFIDEAVQSVISSDPELSLKKTPVSFFDIFAGSGIVSRYGRLNGFEVYSNDLEVYSGAVCRSFVELDSKIAEQEFEVVGKKLGLPETQSAYNAVLDYLNSLDAPKAEKNRYFSCHYAPKDTQNPSFEEERLFYTQENASRIDAILEMINDEALFSKTARDIVLTSLLFQMSVHINTSGVMKGFHNGWGGRGGDALSRIMKPIALKPLPLIDSPVKGRVFQGRAEQIFQEYNLDKVDIVYADPPYNQHQYGANYHLLTTAVLNDSYDPGPVEKGSRAGIRRDHNRSEFCKSTRSDNSRMKKAEYAMQEFVQNLNTRYLIVSYNNEGVINNKKLLDILSNNNKNTIEIKERLYDKFKGGKNTQVSNKVVEYLFIVKIGTPQSPQVVERLKKKITRLTEKHLFIDCYLDPRKAALEIEETPEGYTLLEEKREVLKIDNNFLVTWEHSSQMSREMIKALKKCRLDKTELMELYISDRNITAAVNLLLSFKIKKYRVRFQEFYEILFAMAGEKEKNRLIEIRKRVFKD